MCLPEFFGSIFSNSLTHGYHFLYRERLNFSRECCFPKREKHKLKAPEDVEYWGGEKEIDMHLSDSEAPVCIAAF